MKEQKRGRVIAMSVDERDAYLGQAKMVRLGSVGGDGAPHVSPLWFVWDGSSMWLNSIVKSQRWANLLRNPRVSAVVDGGDAYFELHGVEINGTVEVVGDVPRSAIPDPAVAEAERLFGEKYTGGTFYPDGRHAWLKVNVDKIVSWDFRKLPAAAS